MKHQSRKKQIFNGPDRSVRSLLLSTLLRLTNAVPA